MLVDVSERNLEVVNSFNSDLELNRALNRLVVLSDQVRLLRVDEKCHTEMLNLRNKLRRVRLP